MQQGLFPEILQEHPDPAGGGRAAIAVVAEVVEPGYMINDRILRPAKVIPVRHK